MKQPIKSNLNEKAAPESILPKSTKSQNSGKQVQQTRQSLKETVQEQPKPKLLPESNKTSQLSDKPEKTESKAKNVVPLQNLNEAEDSRKALKNIVSPKTQSVKNRSEARQKIPLENFVSPKAEKRNLPEKETNAQEQPNHYEEPAEKNVIKLEEFFLIEL